MIIEKYQTPTFSTKNDHLKLPTFNPSKPQNHFNMTSTNFKQQIAKHFVDKLEIDKSPS
jgi:hypothetical protein